VMEALAGVEDESIRAAIATDLFGRAGTQLLPMLVNGAEGLADMRQEAHDLGIVFDQEAANKAAAFNDALTKLKGSVSGVMITVGAFLVDALKPLIDFVTEAIKKFGDWSKEHPGLSKAITYTAVAIGGLLVVLGPLLIILPQLTAAYTLLAAVKWATIIPAVWAYVTALWAQVTATLAAMAATGVLIPVAIAAVAAIALLATGITLLVKNQREQYDSTNAVTEATNELAETTTAYGDAAVDAFDEAAGAITQVTKETDKAIDRQKELLGLIGKAYPKGMTMKELQVFGEMQWAAKHGITEVGGYAPGTVGFMRALGYTEYQHGGIVTKPTMALVGEKGPEAIVPLDRMGGITINFTEPVFMDNEGTMNKFVSKIERVIKRNQRLSFGGAYSG